MRSEFGTHLSSGKGFDSALEISGPNHTSLNSQQLEKLMEMKHRERKGKDRSREKERDAARRTKGHY